MEITFVDKKHQLINLKITNDRYFSISGDMGGSSGQINSHIDPRTTDQKILLMTWETQHLKQMDDERFKDILDLCASIEAESNEYRDRAITKEDSDLFEDFERPDAVHALCLMIEACVEDVKSIEEDGNRITVCGIEYLCGDDDEMDEEHVKDIKNYVDECVLYTIPERYRKYFDLDKFIDDAKQDGRGHSLNRWDGSELEYTLNNTTYYAYRQ